MVARTEALVREVLDEVMALGGRALTLRADAFLHAELPELDSMAATSVIALIEDRLALSIEAGDLTGDDFESLNSLTAAIDRLVKRT